MTRQDNITEKVFERLLENRPQSRMRRLKFSVPDAGAPGFFKNVYLNEDYVVKVLGVSPKLLRESAYDPEFRAMVITEHLLMEGWWEDAKKAVGDGLDSVVKKVKSVPDALKEYGDNFKGVVAAMWAATQDGSALESIKNGALQLAGKRLQDIKKMISKIEDKIKSIFGDKAKKVTEMMGKGREWLTEQLGKLSSVAGWKGMLTAAAAYMGFSYLLDAVREPFTTVLKGLSKDLKGFLKGVAKVAGGAAGGDDEGEDDEESLMNRFVEYMKEKVLSIIPNTIKEKLGPLVGNAITALAGPVGWIKQAVEVFEASSWVLEHMKNAIGRGQFRVGGGAGST